VAAYEINELHRTMAVSRQVAEAVASGLGGGPASQTELTVSVSLCFGLIPLGAVEKPSLAIAVGDVMLGTFVAGLAIVIVSTLRGGFRRNPQVGTADGESRNS
jgi:hypothetical protein